MDANSAKNGEQPAGQVESRWLRMRKRVFEEWKRFVAMALYLWVIFGLFVLYQNILLHQHGIDYEMHGFALFNALVLGKIMLVAENMRLARWLPGRPLIYRILFEGFLFSLLFIGFHVLEKMITGLIQGKAAAASVPAIGGGGFEGLASVALIMFVTLIPFFAFRNVSRELGRGRLEAMVFGSGMGFPESHAGPTIQTGAPPPGGKTLSKLPRLRGRARHARFGSHIRQWYGRWRTCQTRRCSESPCATSLPCQHTLCQAVHELRCSF